MSSRRSTSKTERFFLLIVSRLLLEAFFTYCTSLIIELVTARPKHTMKKGTNCNFLYFDVKQRDYNEFQLSGNYFKANCYFEWALSQVLIGILLNSCCSNAKFLPPNL